MKRTLTDLETMRAHELLVQRATEGLDAEAAAELARLGATDVDGFDLAAAAVGALGLGMWIFDHEPPGTTSRLDLAPVIGADLAGATLSGSF